MKCKQDFKEGHPEFTEVDIESKVDQDPREVMKSVREALKAHGLIGYQGVSLKVRRKKGKTVFFIKIEF